MSIVPASCTTNKYNYYVSIADFGSNVRHFQYQLCRRIKNWAFSTVKWCFAPLAVDATCQLSDLDVLGISIIVSIDLDSIAETLTATLEMLEKHSFAFQPAAKWKVFWTISTSQVFTLVLRVKELWLSQFALLKNEAIFPIFCKILLFSEVQLDDDDDDNDNRSKDKYWGVMRDLPGIS